MTQGNHKIARRSSGFASRSLALSALRDVTDDKRLSTVLDDIGQARLKSEDIAFARLLLMQTLRWYCASGWWLSRYCTRRPGKLDGLILRLGIIQQMVLDLPAYAVVSETTALAAPKSRGFVNAVLRRICQDWQARDQIAGRQDLIAHNAPSWLLQRLERDWGAEASRAILEVQSEIPPLDLAFISEQARVDWLARLPESHKAEILPHGAVRIARTAPTQLPGFAEGAFWVQDAAAQIPVWLLRREVAGAKVLELCAAPGGKTAQLLGYNAEVLALDRDGARMQRLQENMRRLRLAPRTVVAEGTSWQVERDFDVVLLDAPCSASGTVRRHPDIALRDHDPRLHAEQKALFAHALHLLKPGGILLYVVCSVRPAEGSALMAQLTEQFSQFSQSSQSSQFSLTPLPFADEDRTALRGLIRPDRLFDMPSHQFQTLPCDAAAIGGMDGFFCAAYRV